MLYFAVFLLGLVFCGFWIAQLVFVFLHLKWSNTIIQSDERDVNVPVTVIHPIKDLDFEFEKNLESWMNQNYKGKVQHIFSFQEPDDPAIKVVEKVKEQYPDKDITIIVNPVIEGLNGKSSNMVHGMKLAKYDIVVFGDSDIRIKEDFLVKMVRPLSDESVGITTCGQINIGGKDFWTRFFSFLQNSETDFMWAFFTKLGFDVGATGAAFGMRKKLLQDIGGLEAFGNSLLEDLHLGNTLYRLGYKIVLGPFIECHIDKLAKEKSFNYAKRIAIGIKTHIAVDLPAFVLLLFWYWALFFSALFLQDVKLLSMALFFMLVRTVHGIIGRKITMNKILPVDIIMPLFFDLFGTFYLFYAFKEPHVSWRGIVYKVKKGGFIEDVSFNEAALYDEAIMDEEIDDEYEDQNRE
ncbi:MAG TPA: glycosyltransferase [Clostridiaceae bacterium]|nr:glycosyltransferase [Clostridiaceae bacterium]